MCKRACQRKLSLCIKEMMRGSFHCWVLHAVQGKMRSSMLLRTLVALTAARVFIVIIIIHVIDAPCALFQPFQRLCLQCIAYIVSPPRLPCLAGACASQTGTLVVSCVGWIFRDHRMYSNTL